MARAFFFATEPQGFGAAEHPRGPQSMRKLIIVIKGMCMGFADVVPGVSGGTIAFVLGIYEQFIEGIKSLNARWLLHLVRWLASGFQRDHLDAARKEFLAIHWGFLIPLGLGIVGAIVIGSRFIPDILESYPEVSRAFFIGLVLASIVVPLQQLEQPGIRELATGLGVAALTFALLGANASSPQTWRAESHDEAVGLRDFTRLYPSTRPPTEVYCPNANAAEPDNDVLREAIQQTEPTTAARLNTICARLVAAGTDVAAIGEVIHEEGLDDKHTDPFNDVVVPANTPVQLPRPAPWFIFFAGMLAICAMALPGISGSFVLLILGAYYFVFSSIKGSVNFLLGSGASLDPLIYVSLFSAGALIGLLGAARVLSWLFEHYRNITLAALIGLMLGSLRVLWPFKVGAMHGGPTMNVLPTGGDPVIESVMALVIGFVIVLGIANLSERVDRGLEAE